MKLLTKEIERRAQAQFHLGSCFDQMVVAKFFHPHTCWTWYLMNIDPDDGDYCWGIVKGLAVETGSFSLKEIEAVKVLGVGVERDLYFTSRSAKSIYADLIAGEHV